MLFSLANNDEKQGGRGVGTATSYYYDNQDSHEKILLYQVYRNNGGARTFFRIYALLLPHL